MLICIAAHIWVCTVSDNNNNNTVPSPSPLRLSVVEIFRRWLHIPHRVKTHMFRRLPFVLRNPRF